MIPSPPGKTDEGSRRPRWPVPVLVATAGVAVVLVGLESDHRTWTLLRNTLVLSGATVALSLPIGAVGGWLLVRTNLPGRRWGLVLLGAMLFVPLFLQAAAWQAGFGLQGWATLAWGLPPWLEGWAGAVWVHALAAVPWAALLAGVGFLLVEPALEEQARLEAAPVQVFRHVSLPGAWIAVGTAAVWVFVTTAGEMTVTDLFMVRTYAEELYTRRAGTGLGPRETLHGMTSELLLLAWLTTVCLALGARLVARQRPAAIARRIPLDLGGLRRPAGVAVWTGLGLLLGVPLSNLGFKAGVVVTQTVQGRVRVWSPVRCLVNVATSPLQHARELGWSLAIATVAATTALLAAVPLAWLASRGRLRAAAVLGLSALLFVLPGTLIALAVIWLLDRPEVPGLAWLYGHSLLAPWLAVGLRVLPPATLVMWYAFRTVPPETLEAAAVDGAGPLARLGWIALPSRLAAPLVAWLVAFAMAVADLAATILVVPPGVTPLSVRIFGLLHYGQEDRVAGICLALILLLAGLAVLAIQLAPPIHRRGTSRAR